MFGSEMNQLVSLSAALHLEAGESTHVPVGDYLRHLHYGLKDSPSFDYVCPAHTRTFITNARMQ